ncbi:MAG: hypothetical protein NTW61_08055 [Candidatus Melainabacteria bacterium]|jgi:hypothetical protein|nr:hypothetical protein [Candidatus Melainabacteria bacterium]
MMMAPAPIPPKQSDFYNVVCNGTWLNRSQFAQAQAEFKTTDNKFQSEQLTQQNKDWFQQQSIANSNPFAKAFATSTVGAAVALPPTVPQASPFVDEARGFYSKLADNMSQIRSSLSLAVIKTVEMPKIMTQGFMALFAVAFLSGKKEATSSTGKMKTEDQEAIMKEADDTRKMPEIFNTNVVKAASGGGGASAQ